MKRDRRRQTRLVRGRSRLRGVMITTGLALCWVATVQRISSRWRNSSTSGGGKGNIKIKAGRVITADNAPRSSVTPNRLRDGISGMLPLHGLQGDGDEGGEEEEKEEELNMSVAICILSRRSAWDRRHMVRQTWLQDVPRGSTVGHVFVVGQDKSFSSEENGRLVKEVETYGDILIAPAEESFSTRSVKTKHCIFWATRHTDFDVLIKTDDDSTLFLGRLLPRWLRHINRDALIYFGWRHPLVVVANPTNVLSEQNILPTTDNFEFEFRGATWPEFMKGGMYGFSRRLAEIIAKNDFWTYASGEDATVGVWMAALRPKLEFLEQEHVLCGEDDYERAEGREVYVTFQTNKLRLVSMWCEYEEMGILSHESIMARDFHRALACLRKFEQSTFMPRSTPLVKTSPLAIDHTLRSLAKTWPITKPNLAETGVWWGNMRNMFRGRRAFVIGNSPSVDRLPLYMLEGEHALVFDGFYRMQERFVSWTPTMYMCDDPAYCRTSSPDFIAFVRPLFALFFPLCGPDGEESSPEYVVRQRMNVHWFVRRLGHHGLKAITHMQRARENKHPTNLHVSSQGPSIAMSLEILAFLGFSHIHMLATEDEMEWYEESITDAARLIRQVYNVNVVLVSEDDGYNKPSPKEKEQKGLFAPESFMALARRIQSPQAEHNPTWDIQLFLHSLPPVHDVEIVNTAKTVRQVFPSIAHCHAFPHLYDVDPAVLCGMEISLKFFEQFSESHVPHGPVREYYVWLKR